MISEPEPGAWEPSEEEAPLLFSDFGLVPA